MAVGLAGSHSVISCRVRVVGQFHWSWMGSLTWLAMDWFRITSAGNLGSFLRVCLLDSLEIMVLTVILEKQDWKHKWPNVFSCLCFYQVGFYLAKAKQVTWLSSESDWEGNKNVKRKKHECERPVIRTINAINPQHQESLFSIKYM